MSEPESTRRQFLRIVGCGAGALAVGGMGLRLVARADQDKVWQIDPNACTACKDLTATPEGLARCATECVLKRSAVRAVNDFEKCGYCFICPAYYDVTSPMNRETGVHVGFICPYDALVRRQVGEFDPSDPKNNFYEYSIDESKCTGCGRCVLNCKPPMGNGSLRLEIRHNLCVDCNQCAIARACPATPPGPDSRGAFYRDRVGGNWPGRTPRPRKRTCGLNRPSS